MLEKPFRRRRRAQSEPSAAREDCSRHVAKRSDGEHAKTRVSHLALCVLGVLALAGCSPGRDSVPVMPEKRLGADAGTGPAQDGYVAVAKKALVTVALASHAGVSRDAAIAALARLADEADACAAKLSESGQLVQGAGSFVAKKKNAETLVDVKTEGGPRAVHNAVLCVVAPLRRGAFAAEGTEGATLVFDVLWGP